MQSKITAKQMDFVKYMTTLAVKSLTFYKFNSTGFWAILQMEKIVTSKKL